MWSVPQTLQQSWEDTSGKRPVKKLDSVGASEKWQPTRVKLNTKRPSVPGYFPKGLITQLILSWSPHFNRPFCFFRRDHELLVLWRENTF